MPQKLTFGSLFAGIGGFDLGFERAGMVCKWQVEKDEFCLKVLAKHWPNVRRYTNVKEVGKHNLKTVDVIVGGFPCQPFSSSGSRRSTEDDRYLWPEFYRIVCEIRPRWVMAENVTRLLSIDDGRVFGEIIRQLAQVGYIVEWDCLPAIAFGSLHQRDRLFIIAHTEHSGFSGSGPCQQKRKRQEMERRKQSGGNGRIGVMAQAITPLSTWETQPGIQRVANGVPGTLDRLKAIGNAVVPQIAQYLGDAIIRADSFQLRKNKDEQNHIGD
jgi:DNA (cytosine-5)-methyltransferase 1